MLVRMIQKRLKMMLEKRRRMAGETSLSNCRRMGSSAQYRYTSAWSAHLATGRRLNMCEEVLVKGSGCGGRQSEDQGRES